MRDEEGHVFHRQAVVLERQHPGLAKFKRPRYFKFVGEIPLTATGKKRRFMVKQWAQEDLRKGELTR